MIHSIRDAYRVLVVACSLCLALAAGLATSQGDPMSPGRFAPQALVGDWAIQFPNEGGPPTFGTVTYRPDGSYQETLIIGGETAGWWRGRYTLAPDGTLVLEETGTSPQLCFAGQCQPNDPPTRTVARLVALDASSYSATYVDESGMPATLTFQRVAGGQGPAPSAPGAAPGGVPGVAPRGAPERRLERTRSGAWSRARRRAAPDPDGPGVPDGARCGTRSATHDTGRGGPRLEPLERHLVGRRRHGPHRWLGRSRARGRWSVVPAEPLRRRRAVDGMVRERRAALRHRAATHARGRDGGVGRVDLHPSTHRRRDRIGQSVGRTLIGTSR